MDMMNYAVLAGAVGVAVAVVGLIILFCLVKALAQGKLKVVNGKVTFDMSAHVKPTPIVVQTVNVNDDAVVAAITAALACIMEEEQKADPQAPKKTFVVRSIRRVTNAPAWNRAGREEQIYSRM